MGQPMKPTESGPQKPSWAWRFLGAMFSEPKDGIQAISMHRILAFTLFIACLVLWLGTEKGVVHDSMLYTLWGLLGINGAHKVAGSFKSQPAISPLLLSTVQSEEPSTPDPEPII